MLDHHADHPLIYISVWRTGCLGDAT